MADVEGMIGPAFAAALDAGRERFNALFAQARRRAPGLDGGTFLQFLQRRVGPIVAAVETTEPDRVPGVVAALYGIGLELLPRGLVGESDQPSPFEEDWFQLMATVGRHHPAELAELAGRLTNGLHHLSRTPRCRPHTWVTRFCAAAPQCRNGADLVAAGQVAAWLSGMAHYRSAALDTARMVPANVMARLLDLNPAPSDVVEQLHAHRWIDPCRNRTTSGLRIVAETGGFRGLGGEFQRPPLVQAADDGFLVSDGTSHWLLTADAFGATFHRVPATQKPTRGGAFSITKAGLVHGPNGKQQIVMLASSSSHASTADTLAVTLPHSHRIFLVSEAPA